SSSLSVNFLCAGAIIASGASVLGIAWVGGLVLFVLMYWIVIKCRSITQIIVDNRIALAVSALCIGLFIIHDLRMFMLGRRPALIHETNFLTIIFSVYCNLGLLGVGPGMLDLRANGANALISFGPSIAFAAIILGLIAIAGFREILKIFGLKT